MIKLGVCRGIEDAQTAYEAGFDYIECGFGQIMSLPQAEFDEWKRKLADSPIPCAAMNGMLPGKFRLTGPDADLKPVREFLSEAFERAGEIGLPVVVFGSGAARNIPQDRYGNLLYPFDKALDQVAEYLQMAGDLAQPYGVIIAIEPLRAMESNIIRTVADGVSMAQRVAHPNVKVLADAYHMAEMGEGAQAVLDAGSDMLRHCHTANPWGRVYPTGDDRWDYTPFFDALKQIGYQGGVSVEAGCSDFAQAAKRAFEVLDPLRK